MKRLIVNADDFGFTRDVNSGIVEAHRGGILTACTLMANGAAFDDAVSLARETPTLDVGCHLVFVQGPSVSDTQRALPADLKGLLRAVLLGRMPIYEEAAAQIRKLIAAGIRPTHLDTHKHTHLLAPVLKAVTRVAHEFGIEWVRQRLGFGLPGGLRTTDHFRGYRLTGSLNECTLGKALKSLPDGLTEFMCHPGLCGPELRNAATRLKESREIELAALLSPVTRKLIRDEKIQLTNYRRETVGIGKNENA